MGTLIEKIRPGLRPLPTETPFKNIHVLIATWFGFGLLKPASGTIGTLAALPFGYALAYFTGMVGLILATVILLGIGTISAGYYGRKSGQKDNQAIVVDEVVGVWIAAIPAATNINLWIIAFILFRLFDIYKPWPASYFDNKETGGGFNVMMDDVVAGFYAFLGVAASAFTVYY